MLKEIELRFYTFKRKEKKEEKLLKFKTVI